MKRLIICCDGTWHDAGRARPSNVLHLARAIAPRAPDGCHQVLHYQPGIGSDFGRPLTAAALGHGIDRDIQEAYRFLVHNYADGDEIWCFGYSRGAYTVRSLIGLLRNAWLLHKREAARIIGAYHVYRTLWGPDADNAIRFRERWARPVKVQFLGVWETVGSLGIPLALFDGLNQARYAFHDTRLSNIVSQARHALAIDERRELFTPTLWHTGAHRSYTEQCWFSGAHADVGGGKHEGGLAAISLDWLAGEAAACGLALDADYLDAVRADAGAAVVHRRARGLWRLWPREWREIGKTNGDETLHSSAQERFLHNSSYRPPNLQSYLRENDQLRLPL